jgi:hypothetical protein
MEDVIRKVLHSMSHSRVYTNAKPSVIHYNSPIEMALQESRLTKYVHESEFRFLETGSVARYLATTCVLNCVAMFVHARDGTTFCAHISPTVMDTALHEAIYIYGDRIMFKRMARRLKKVFGHMKASDLTISLVGGWSLADRCPVRMGHRIEYDGVWKFSSIIKTFVAQMFPGSRVDISQLNRFEGVGWDDRTSQHKMTRVALGEAFRIAVINRTTGKISLQTTDTCDLTGLQGEGASVPDRVKLEGVEHLSQMQERYRAFDFNWAAGDAVPTPVLQEYVGVL